jgi:hypothetical protein
VRTATGQRSKLPATTCCSATQVLAGAASMRTEWASMKGIESLSIRTIILEYRF